MAMNTNPLMAVTTPARMQYDKYFCELPSALPNSDPTIKTMPRVVRTVPNQAVALRKPSNRSRASSEPPRKLASTGFWNDATTLGRVPWSNR